jgi:serine/threonine protein kinase
MILRVQSMHSQEYLHRDIKPENFLIGNTKKVNTIYAIDFGLSKRFIDPKTGNHNIRKKTKFAGTPRYASVNAHNKYQQCRADDLEAIGNILIYFFNEGKLPWMYAEK